jgi:hypothetical protein
VSVEAAPGLLSGRFFDCFTGFAGVLLNPTKQFLGLAFDILEFVVRELGQFLFQLTLNDVAVAFDFERGHNFVILILSVRSFRRELLNGLAYQ